ncbi:5935_t:CDS:2, partial [Ambispora leptoticha]
KIHGEIFKIWVGLQRQIVLSSAELIEQLNIPSAKGNFIIRYAYHEGLEAWGTDTGITFNQVGDLIETPHRNEKYFTDPEKFIPERFINDGNDGKNFFKKAFYPWGGGLNICSARNIGLAFVKMLLILLYRNDEVKLVNADKQYFKIPT